MTIDRNTLNIAIARLEAGVRLLKQALEEPATEASVMCPRCSSSMVLREGVYGPYYGCPNFPDCDMLVGAKRDGTPKGVPADKVTRDARRKAHAAFDPLWQDGIFESRPEAYKWLAKKTDCKKHMQDMSKEECDRVTEICKAYRAALAKQKGRA